MMTRSETDVVLSRAVSQSSWPPAGQLPLRFQRPSLRVCIGGTRKGPTLSDVFAAMRAAKVQGLARPTLVNSGHYGDADLAGERWAELHEIPVKLFPPDWDGLGPTAGPVRDFEMAKASDAVVLVWDRSSDGSRTMLDVSRELGKPVYSYDYTLKEMRVFNGQNVIGPLRGARSRRYH